MIEDGSEFSGGKRAGEGRREKREGRREKREERREKTEGRRERREERREKKTHVWRLLYALASSRWPWCCLLYTSPSPRDATLSRMPSSA